MSETEHKDVRVARISARQAIIVALITAVAGLGGALIQKYSSPSGSQKTRQPWIRINSVGSETDYSSSEPVRLLIKVNGTAFFSSPTGKAFASLGSRMEARFPLPIAEDKSYRISFEVFNQDQFTRWKSKEVVEVRQLPFEPQSTLFPEDAFGNKTFDPNIIVRFELRDDL